MGSQVNSENDEFYPTLADNNNLYFTMQSDSGLGKMIFITANGTEHHTLSLYYLARISIVKVMSLMHSFPKMRIC